MKLPMLKICRGKETQIGESDCSLRRMERAARVLRAALLRCLWCMRTRHSYERYSWISMPCLLTVIQVEGISVQQPEL